MKPSPPPPHSLIIFIVFVVVILAPALATLACLEETQPALLGVKPPPSSEWPIVPNVGPEDDHDFGDDRMVVHLEDDDDDDDEERVVGGEGNRRSLLWWRRRFRYYYISYRALAAGKVPCPSRSGRSYYTHNCYTTKVPVNPYTRGCSAITRCRR